MSEMIRAIHAADTICGFLLASMVDTQGHSQSMPCVKGTTVSSSRAGFVDRRDAAMAAVLAGGVVIILGYASGIGLTPTDAATAAPPAAQPPAATAPAAPVTTPPPAAPIAQPAMPAMPAMPGTSTLPDMSMPMEPTGTATPEPDPEPTPSPEPTDAADVCPPSVLGSLPAVGQLTSSLLSSVLSTTPVVSDLAGPPVTGKAPGPLTCLVGTLVGPTCCTTTATTAAEDAK